MPELLRHPLSATLAAAALVQAVLLLLVRAPVPVPPRPTALSSGSAGGSDTAELLNLSRRVAPSAVAPVGLSNLLSLPLPPPPPPPSDLGIPEVPRAERAAAQAPAAAQRPSASTPTAAAPPAVAGLPSQPGPALELALAVAEGAGRSIPNDGVTQAMAAVQRRQWWLDPAQQRQLQRAWEQAEGASAPESWGVLPPGLQVRRLTSRTLGGLAEGDARGRSLVSRHQLTLLWLEGQELWLLRLPLG